MCTHSMIFVELIQFTVKMNCLRREDYQALTKIVTHATCISMMFC